MGQCQSSKSFQDMDDVTPPGRKLLSESKKSKKKKAEATESDGNSSSSSTENGSGSCGNSGTTSDSKQDERRSIASSDKKSVKNEKKDGGYKEDTKTKTRDGGEDGIPTNITMTVLSPKSKFRTDKNTNPDDDVGSNSDMFDGTRSVGDDFSKSYVPEDLKSHSRDYVQIDNDANIAVLSATSKAKHNVPSSCWAELVENTTGESDTTGTITADEMNVNFGGGAGTVESGSIVVAESNNNNKWSSMLGNNEDEEECKEDEDFIFDDFNPEPFYSNDVKEGQQTPCSGDQTEENLLFSNQSDCSMTFPIEISEEQGQTKTVKDGAETALVVLNSSGIVPYSDFHAATIEKVEDDNESSISFTSGASNDDVALQDKDPKPSGEDSDANQVTSDQGEAEKDIADDTVDDADDQDAVDEAPPSIIAGRERQKRSFHTNDQHKTTIATRPSMVPTRQQNDPPTASGKKIPGDNRSWEGRVRRPVTRDSVQRNRSRSRSRSRSRKMNETASNKHPPILSPHHSRSNSNGSVTSGVRSFDEKKRNKIDQNYQRKQNEFKPIRPNMNNRAAERPKHFTFNATNSEPSNHGSSDEMVPSLTASSTDSFAAGGVSGADEMDNQNEAKSDYEFVLMRRRMRQRRNNAKAKREEQKVASAENMTESAGLNDVKKEDSHDEKGRKIEKPHGESRFAKRGGTPYNRPIDNIDKLVISSPSTMGMISPSRTSSMSPSREQFSSSSLNYTNDKPALPVQHISGPTTPAYEVVASQEQKETTLTSSEDEVTKRDNLDEKTQRLNRWDRKMKNTDVRERARAAPPAHAPNRPTRVMSPVPRARADNRNPITAENRGRMMHKRSLSVDATLSRNNNDTSPPSSTASKNVKFQEPLESPVCPELHEPGHRAYEGSSTVRPQQQPNNSVTPTFVPARTARSASPVPRSMARKRGDQHKEEMKGTQEVQQRVRRMSPSTGSTPRETARKMSRQTQNHNNNNNGSNVDDMNKRLQAWESSQQQHHRRSSPSPASRSANRKDEGAGAVGRSNRFQRYQPKVNTTTTANTQSSSRHRSYSPAMTNRISRSGTSQPRVSVSASEDQETNCLASMSEPQQHQAKATTASTRAPVAPRGGLKLSKRLVST